MTAKTYPEKKATLWENVCAALDMQKREEIIWEN